jgi:hypothetical protein
MFVPDTLIWNTVPCPHCGELFLTHPSGGTGLHQCFACGRPFYAAIVVMPGGDVAIAAKSLHHQGLVSTEHSPAWPRWAQSLGTKKKARFAWPVEGARSR